LPAQKAAIPASGLRIVLHAVQPQRQPVRRHAVARSPPEPGCPPQRQPFAPALRCAAQTCVQRTQPKGSPRQIRGLCRFCRTPVTGLHQGAAVGHSQGRAQGIGIIGAGQKPKTIAIRRGIAVEAVGVRFANHGVRVI